LQNLAMIGVTILVLAIVLGMGAQITYKISDTMVASETISNETLTTLSITVNESVSCAVRSHFTFSEGSVMMTNTSGGIKYVVDTDYIAYSTGVISWLNVTDAGDYNITYTCSYCNTSSCSVMENGSAGLGELAGWIPTIAIIIAAALIVGIVITYFVVKRT